MSGPFAKNCGGWDAVRFFSVTAGAGERFVATGWVVQEIEVNKLVFDCSGHRIRSDYWHYWEAFKVDNGTIVSADGWEEPEEGVCTQGYGFASGKASYYNSNIASNPPWTRDPSHPSRGAPHIPIPPGLPVGSTGNSGTVTAQVYYSWNCCRGASLTTFR